MSVCWVALCWMALCWVALCWVALCWVALCWGNSSFKKCFAQSGIMLSVIMLSGIMLSVVMLNVSMLSVIILSVIIPTVAAPENNDLLPLTFNVSDDGRFNWMTHERKELCECQCYKTISSLHKLIFTLAKIFAKLPVDTTLILINKDLIFVVLLKVDLNVQQTLLWIIWKHLYRCFTK